MIVSLIKTIRLITFITITLFLTSGSCYSSKGDDSVSPIITGAEQVTEWLPLLEGKSVGLLLNHTALVEDVHLVDTLLSIGVDIAGIFVPEHGFRGDADAGELIDDGVDPETGLPIISLYSNNRKPTQDQIDGIDIFIFDIQDVGVRFYTYISSLHYLMEACAEFDIPLIVLDRPNPNIDYIDGPVLKPAFTSFVGMHPIPVVHGLTVGELALMINGEGWLENDRKCKLTVVPVKNYSRDMHYSVPVPPSPNLPNDLAIRLYPSLCFFEATEVSIGRGTYFPFQVIGYPDSTYGEFSFTPRSIIGMSTSPPQQDEECFGVDLRELEPFQQRFTLKYYLDFYERSGCAEGFTSRRRWFNLLAGTDELIRQIEDGLSEDEIRQSWQKELQEYDERRQPYLLYNTN